MAPRRWPSRRRTRPSMDVRRIGPLYGSASRRQSRGLARRLRVGFVNGTTNTSTGLTRLGAREYDPALGRFISVDPIIDHADPQQMNGYAYSNNSPVTFTDPDGLKTWESDTGPTTDSQVVTKKVFAAGLASGSRAKTQDFGGRCPAGQKQSCAATSRKHSAVNRARNHDPGAKPDPSAYDPEHYWDWNDGVFSIVGACAPETGRFYGTTRCSATQVQLAHGSAGALRADTPASGGLGGKRAGLGGGASRGHPCDHELLRRHRNHSCRGRVRGFGCVRSRGRTRRRYDGGHKRAFRYCQVDWRGHHS